MCRSRKYPNLPLGRDFSKTPSSPTPLEASYISLNFYILQNPPLPRKFQSLLWGKYEYFLELQNVSKAEQKE